MSGVVLATLSDDELQRLIVWYGAAKILDPVDDPVDDALADKIQGWRDGVTCSA